MDKRLDLTTGLDLCGLGLVAGGVGAGMWSWIGAFGLVPAGLIVIGASWAAGLFAGRGH